MAKMTAWLDRQTDPPLVCVRQESGHGPHVASIMKAVHGDVRWDRHRQLWVFPYLPASVWSLGEAARMLGLELELPRDLELVRRAVTDETEREIQIRKMIQRYIDDKKLPIHPYKTQSNPPPWHHQQVAYHWGIRVRSLYLQHKMGLGKTREGADILRGKWENGEIQEPQQFLAPAGPSAVDPTRMLPEQWCISGGVLVMAPRASMVEWVEQLWRWQGIEALAIAGDSEEKRRRAGTVAWIHVCSYESLEHVERNRYSMILGDELHYIANADSNRFKRALELRRKCRSTLGLSGTAESNGLESLWAQYFWLDGGRTLGPSLVAFRKRFIAKEAREPGETPEQAVAKAIARITWPLSMQEAFPDKPQKIHRTVRVPMTSEQASYYEKVRQQAYADILTGRINVTETMTRLTKLLQITSGFVIDDKRNVQQFSSAKLKALEEMLAPKGELADKRVIVWCRFRPELHAIEAMLKRHGIKHMLLHGDVTEQQKQRMKDAWNTQHEWKVMVGMISMGIGLNLHAPKCVDAEGKPARCSTTVFYGLDWKQTQVEQAMDRVYRGDQVESCLYVYLLSDDLDSSTKDKKPVVPIDVRIYESLMAKIDHAKEVNEASIDYIRGLLAA